jgi:hypothetical protein
MTYESKRGSVLLQSEIDDLFWRIRANSKLLKSAGFTTESGQMYIKFGERVIAYQNLRMNPPSVEVDGIPVYIEDAGPWWRCIEAMIPNMRKEIAETEIRIEQFEKEQQVKLADERVKKLKEISENFS